MFIILLIIYYIMIYIIYIYIYIYIYISHTKDYIYHLYIRYGSRVKWSNPGIYIYISLTFANFTYFYIYIYIINNTAQSVTLKYTNCFLSSLQI